MQSLTSRYATVVQKTQQTSTRWVWPSERGAGESSPDPRLMNYNILNTVANVQLPEGGFAACSVRAVTDHDLVLTCEDDRLLPMLGQPVEVCVIADGAELLNSTVVLHWCGEIYGETVVAGFSIDEIPNGLKCKTDDCSRGEIRFPLEISAAVAVAPGKDVFGRIIDYSLSGCRFLAEEMIDLDHVYSMTALMPFSSVKVDLHPRWVLNTSEGFQLGCSLEEEQGVLLASRHHST